MPVRSEMVNNCVDPISSTCPAPPLTTTHPSLGGIGIANSTRASCGLGLNHWRDSWGASWGAMATESRGCSWVSWRVGQMSRLGFHTRCFSLN